MYMDTDHYKVLVLILTYNGKHLLTDCIPSYLANDYPNFEVVVIDNGSIDGTLEYVKDNWPGVSVVRTEKNLGYSGGFNFGLEYAFEQQNADYVLISNNDVKADPKVITELIKVAEQDTMVGFVTGKVYYFDQPNVLQSVGKKGHPILWNGGHIGNRDIDKGQYDMIAERAFADDVFTLVRRELYQQIGGYDETFFLQSEEYDWQARAKKKGYKIYYTPYAKVWHKESMTIGKRSLKKAFYNARNPMLVILRNKDKYFFRRFFWYNLRKRVIKSSIKKAAHLRPDHSIAILLGFTSAIIWGVRNKAFSRHHFI